MEQNADAVGAVLGGVSLWFIVVIGLFLVPWIAVIAAAHDRGNSMLGAAFIGLFGTPLIGLLYVIAQPINQQVLDERAIRSGKLRRCTKCMKPKHPSASWCPHCGAGDRPYETDMRAPSVEAESSSPSPQYQAAPAGAAVTAASTAASAPASPASEADRWSETLKAKARDEDAERTVDFPHNDMPAGMTVTEEYFERAETDTDAAEEFRRKMEQRRDPPAGR